MLEYFLREYPSELTADLRQYYQINLYDVQDGIYPRRFIADLAAQLPKDARVWRAIDPDLAWSEQEQVLAFIEYWLHQIYYGFLTDEQRQTIPAPELWIPTNPKTRAEIKNGTHAAKTAKRAQAFAAIERLEQNIKQATTPPEGGD